MLFRSIEILANRQDLALALGALAHRETWLAVAAERAVSRAMGGSCSMPLAAHAVWQGERLYLRAAWGEADFEARGAMPFALIRAERAAAVLDAAGAESLGQQIAADLVAAGAVAMHAATPGSTPQEGD